MWRGGVEVGNIAASAELADLSPFPLFLYEEQPNLGSCDKGERKRPYGGWCVGPPTFADNRNYVSARLAFQLRGPDNTDKSQ